MPSWNQLLNKFDSLPNEKVFVKTLRSESLKRLREIGRLRGNRHVIFYWESTATAAARAGSKPAFAIK